MPEKTANSADNNKLDTKTERQEEGQEEDNKYFSLIDVANFNFNEAINTSASNSLLKVAPLDGKSKQDSSVADKGKDRRRKRNKDSLTAEEDHALQQGLLMSLQEAEKTKQKKAREEEKQTAVDAALAKAIIPDLNTTFVAPANYSAEFFATRKE